MYSKDDKKSVEVHRNRKDKTTNQQNQSKKWNETIKENTLNEIGVFPIQNYIKGIIPSSELQIMNDKDREKVKSLIKDLVFTLNELWKSHKIPFRVREPRCIRCRKFKHKNKRY